jgi:hypothetical protein
MAIANKALLLDLIDWIDVRPRTYEETMDAWGTSCPRLPVWEDAIDLGFVARTVDERHRAIVEVTSAGRAFLRAARPALA